MGLLQKACETYDNHQGYIGVEREGHEMLPCLYHMVTKADIEITIDKEGRFIVARDVSKEGKITIPVTEESGGRTSSPCAHPLCDQLGYISSFDLERYNLYLNQLKTWRDSLFTHPIIIAVYAYVNRQTILDDLIASKIIKIEEKEFLHNKHKVTDKDKKRCEKISKLFIRWRVEGIGEESGPCWNNKRLFQLFCDWYLSSRNNSNKQFCMISGEDKTCSINHPKGIISKFGNAKLISYKDDSGLRYKGRFLHEEEALTIGFETSQKAHIALHWLISEQSPILNCNRVFLCWNPKGITIPQVTGPIIRKEKCSLIYPSDYKKQLALVLNSYNSNLPDKSNVVIAVFDASTKGRLSLTYYNELVGSDFLKRLELWDLNCCWFWDSQKYKSYFHKNIESPSLINIVNVAFGNQEKENGKLILKANEKIVGQEMQRLFACRVDAGKFPFDIERLVVQKSSDLKCYPIKYNNQETYLRDNVLFTACAVIKKYYFDHYKEELSMSLEPSKPNRSYQFGRLLAVLEKAERDTFEKDEEREPNAMRLQSAYCKRPLHMFRIIQEQVKKGYYPKLSTASRIYYDKLIGEIMEVISSESEDQLNRPLEDLYLIGYYLQRKELYTSNKEQQGEL